MTDPGAGAAAVPPARRAHYRQLPPGPGRRRAEVLANQRSRLLAATIELVAERGYGRTTVREIVALAGVSKATFYEQFGGKEDCFLATYDTALRGAASAVMRGEGAAGAAGERPRAGLAALAELVATEPKAAKLVLIDALASTPPIREHVGRRFGLLEELVHERLAAASGGAAPPRAVIAGIVQGIAHHARRCVSSGRHDRFRELVDPLLDWSLGFGREEALESLRAEPPPLSAGAPPSETPAATARPLTRDLLTSATLRIASSEGYGALTPIRIRRAAGVSRRSFDACFDSVADCFLAAVDAELDTALDEALRRSRGDPGWAGRTCRAVGSFVAHFAAAPDLARLVFAEVSAAAPASLRWHEGLVVRAAEALYATAPPGNRPPPVLGEAAIAAAWGILASQAGGRRPRLLLAQRRRIAFVVLAPALGGSAAARAVEDAWPAPTRRGPGHRRSTAPANGYKP